MTTLRFIRENARWLAAGVLLTWSSSFGQTYFISLSSGALRETFGLSHAGWGMIYTLGTLASACTLMLAGHLADQMRVRTLAVFTIGGFAAMCLAMAAVPHWLMLIPIIFGLRFCGQGMMSHLAMTAMARWFRGKRGRAIGIASLGFAMGEGLLPLIFVSLIGVIGWRTGWVIAAAVLLAFSLPLTMMLLRQERTPQSMPESFHVPGMGGMHWTRQTALRHWLMWTLLPGLLAPSFIVTSLFFHQVHFTDVKQWSLASYVALYPLYSALTVSSNMATGFLIDRIGSARMLPFYLLPLACGIALLGSASAFWTAPVGLLCIGLSQGASQSLIGAIWPEYYGTRYLGSIRAMAVSGMVLSTAIGPGLTGWLIDLGIGIETQLVWMAAYLVIASAGFVFVSRTAERLRAQVQRYTAQDRSTDD